MRKSRVVVDVLIVFFAALFSYFLFMQFEFTLILFLSLLLLSLFALFWIHRAIFDYRASKDSAPPIFYKDTIYELALINERGEIVKTWVLHGIISAVIGKSGLRTHVDIDLKDSEYAALIDEEHAIINYTERGWYIEDNYSRNGIFIQKHNDSQKYSLSKQTPLLFEKGDILYIATARLLVR